MEAAAEQGERVEVDPWRPSVEEYVAPITIESIGVMELRSRCLTVRRCGHLRRKEIAICRMLKMRACSMPMRFPFKVSKAIAVIRFLAECEIPALTKGKINKLVFLADKLHLVRFGRPITGDWYAAMPHGPVPSRIDNLLDAFEDENGTGEAEPLRAQIGVNRVFRYPRYFAIGTSDLPNQQLSTSDFEALREVVTVYKYRTFDELRTLTHEMPAYEIAWAERSGQRGQMRFEDFFEDDENAIAGVFEEAVENSAIAARFPEPAWD